jgi:hypothetical protein
MCAGGGWKKLLKPVVADRVSVTEGELLGVVLLAGRKVNPDWQIAITRCMLAMGFKRRKGGKFVRCAPAVVAGQSATIGGAS